MREESPLARMFSGQFLIEEKVPTFIDRDGTHFSYILNFLRDGGVDLPDDDLTKRQLVQEARFYGLPKLERQLTRGLWTVGTTIDAQDTLRKWYPATIKDAIETSFLVSFEGRSKKWNSWLSKDSPRLGTHPLQKNRFFLILRSGFFKSFFLYVGWTDILHTHTDRFEGDRNSLSERHGRGTLTTASGDKYVGKWKHGRGTGTWASGAKYRAWEDAQKASKLQLSAAKVAAKERRRLRRATSTKESGKTASGGLLSS